MSAAVVIRHAMSGDITVIAEGGNRRSRAARMSAAVRGMDMYRRGVRYSETYGFQTQTEAIYSPR